MRVASSFPPRALWTVDRETFIIFAAEGMSIVSIDTFASCRPGCSLATLAATMNLKTSTIINAKNARKRV
jgi:hypothetical protein